MLISPSMLSAFNECPYKFKILHVDGRRPLSKPEFEFGRRVHRVIAEYYSLLPSDATPNEVPMCLGQAIKRVVGEADEGVIRYLHGFERFERQRLTWHIDPRPLMFEKEVVKGYLRGIVDAVFRRGEETIIVDWKTGMARDPTVDEHLKIQGNVYMYLLNAREIYFIFLRFNDWHRLSYDEAFIMGKLKAFVDAFNSRSYPRNEGAHCDRCEVNLHCYFDKHGLKWWEL